MLDQVFGELKKDGDYGWYGEQKTLDFGGNTYTVDILVQGEEISSRQKEAFVCFMEKWPGLQISLIEALIQYYNGEERFSYGPEDEEEEKEWWPEI